MSESSFDVVVAGGGPVGWACALAAQLALGKSCRVAVVERDSALPLAEGAMLSPRVYTVAARNLYWLDASGVKINAHRAATVASMVVCGRDGGQSLSISANDTAENELAKVLEHEALTHAIAMRAQELGVRLVSGSCTSLHTLDGQRLIELADRRILHARLVVAADGVGSALRQAAGITPLRRDYPQRGVVAHFRCADPHRGIARQWFLPDGSILALLPLPDVSGEPAMSMVWSAAPERADELCAMSVDELLKTVNAVAERAVAVTAVLSETRMFPLTLVRTANPVADRLVVVGDAAHAVHPLAGQGVNLGLADARVLQDAWQQSHLLGNDPGHALLLGRYRRERFAPTLAMQLATDGLFRLYNQVHHPLLMAAGDAGMRLLGRVPAFRRTLSTAALQ